MTCFEEIETIGRLMKLREDLIEAIENNLLIPWSKIRENRSHEKYHSIVTYIDYPNHECFDEGTIICDKVVDDYHCDIVSTYDDFLNLKIRLVKWFNEEENVWEYDVSIEDHVNPNKEKLFFSELFDNRWVFNKEN